MISYVNETAIEHIIKKTLIETFNLDAKELDFFRFYITDLKYMKRNQKQSKEYISEKDLYVCFGTLLCYDVHKRVFCNRKIKVVVLIKRILKNLHGLYSPSNPIITEDIKHKIVFV
ncbi:MAG: hypothetical protein NZZ41_06900 [Candidatus Dojkabacteria bacterium]|nr:hypothetical protein [Candidatus Dojkabacteria bacterium]